MKPESKEILLLIILFALCAVGQSQTKDSVREYIEQSDIHHKEIVLRQSIQETGWYKSYSCRVRNNLFGFSYKGKYLEFDHWKESVDYYSRWQSRHYKSGNYYDFLIDRGYAEDPEYINKLKRINIRR